MIVDDDATLAAQWCAELEEAGYEVGYCDTIDKGFEACLMRWPDAIILDAFFRDEEGSPTGKGGVLFCTQLSLHATKSGDKLPHIIGVTASRQTKYFPVDVFSLVAREVMPIRMRKPFPTGELLAAVDGALRVRR